MSLLFNRFCIVVIILPLLAFCMAWEIILTAMEVMIAFPRLVKTMWKPQYKPIE